MSDDNDYTVNVAPKTYVSVYVLDPDEPFRLTIEGDLRTPGSGWSCKANYEVESALRPLFPDVEFDPESSWFFAYTESREDAVRLINAIRDWMVEHGRV
jgi:hypothetical protein